MNFDHIAIRDPQSKSYKKVSAKLQNNGESSYSKMVYSDYIFKFDANFKKTKVILLVTD